MKRGEQRNVDMLVGLNRMVQQRVSYVVRMEPGVWTPEETLAAGKGSCRDSAWLLVQLLRQLGYAARFVSGYLIQLVADVKPLEGPEGPTADFCDLHAWAEVYLPGAGWVGLDPTSGLMAGEGHIPLAATPDPQSAAPISGLVEPCETEFGFDMKLTRVRETPRVTKPYTEAQWQDILAMGAAVDRSLARGDIRLTMGGEPTFVSASDFEAAEWTTDALGPTKQRLARRLMRRLQPLWSPGAALQNVFGKHYPGEQLPRWALYSHWRADGEAIWRDPGLFAEDEDNEGATAADAARFCGALAERLQVDPSLVRPAYEDVHYYLWREHRLPANVLAEDAKLRDPLERERLARVFGQGLESPVGSVLPLRRALRDGVRIWQSEEWIFRGDRCSWCRVIRPSATGCRWKVCCGRMRRLSSNSEADPFARRGPLPPLQALLLVTSDNMGAGAEGFRPVVQSPPEVGRGEPDLVRTALTVEARGGVIRVFFPPLYDAEDWLALATAIEDTATELGRKVVLEGYLPPRDPRLKHFSVTPDPGVIEVNVHPSASWPELIERGETLYEEARQVGLATEKFMLDGRHTGTGGGNHVVMGAAEVADSPFLRRPDLLKSLLGFWHNHPSLSYLFSGLFIGPSSQHPRIDEARQDILAELETAFAQIGAGREAAALAGGPAVPQYAGGHDREYPSDRVLYRQNVCTGDEFRAAGAGGVPRAGDAAAWADVGGAASADARGGGGVLGAAVRAAAGALGHAYPRRFHVAAFCGAGFWRGAGRTGRTWIPLDPAWFAPHLEFRFPKIGEVSVRGVGLELRHALEPWHTLGEEPAAGGTVRYVDSSVERVQATVSGWVGERYVLACNGHAVPVTPTDRAGELVGGVRFKAWQPPNSLHPTIAAHTPLVFDIYDRWTGRSLGGLTHHVSHPGGLSYEHFPVNANEAEARRRSRFFPIGHTPGPMAEPAMVRSREHPRTLDLRRV